MKQIYFGLLIHLFAIATPALAWDSSRLSVPIVINERTIHYPEFAIYVLPGQSFTVHYRDSSEGGTIDYLGETHTVGASRLRAPDKPGLVDLVIRNTARGETAVIHVFVMVPSGNVGSDGKLNGYRIGNYPAQPLKGNAIYKPPEGFIEVTAENADTRISPNFRLRDFLSKQQGSYPKYLVLRANLLLKLETLLAALNNNGHSVNALKIMSGYRTPWYNKAIGNVPYSRHVWGGAADIYIDDNPRDGRMDDMNKDKVINRKDAVWLADIVNQLSRRGEFGNRIGGLGVYGSNAVRGPFIHVDVRGSIARW